MIDVKFLYLLWCLGGLQKSRVLRCTVLREKREKRRVKDTVLWGTICLLSFGNVRPSYLLWKPVGGSSRLCKGFDGSTDWHPKKIQLQRRCNNDLFLVNFSFFFFNPAAKHLCCLKKVLCNRIWSVIRLQYQFWSPLFMTEVAKHSFSLTDHGSVGPIESNLCSADWVIGGWGKWGKSISIHSSVLFRISWFKSHMSNLMFSSHLGQPKPSSCPDHKNLWTPT